MAIFKKKTKDEAKDEAVKPAEKEIPKTPARIDAVPAAGKLSLAHILLHPRVTEKATDASMRNAYIFEVDPRANKEEIKQAVLQLYGVKPEKVHTMPIPSKNIFSRGKVGTRSGGKKAVIYLKEGDTIEFV